MEAELTSVVWQCHPHPQGPISHYPGTAHTDAPRLPSSAAIRWVSWGQVASASLLDTMNQGEKGQPGMAILSLDEQWNYLGSFKSQLDPILRDAALVGWGVA